MPEQPGEASKARIDSVMGVTDQASRGRAAWQGPFPSALLGRDALLLNQFQERSPRWFEVAIDLSGCDPVLVRTEALVEAFLLALCDQLKVHRSGEARLVSTEQSEHTRELVVTQAIETGAIVAHLAASTHAVCLTIVTCRAFTAYRTARFCQEWLSAQAGQLIVTFRGAYPE